MVESRPANHSPGAIKFGELFSTLGKMNSNASSDSLERKLSAPGEKDPEVGPALSFAALKMSPAIQAILYLYGL